MTRNEELIKDINKVGRRIGVSTDSREFEALQKLIIILESWKNEEKINR